jgi:hypothetical protein
VTFWFPLPVEAQEDDPNADNTYLGLWIQAELVDCPRISSGFPCRAQIAKFEFQNLRNQILFHESSDSRVGPWSYRDESVLVDKLIWSHPLQLLLSFIARHHVAVIS